MKFVKIVFILLFSVSCFYFIMMEIVGFKIESGLGNLSRLSKQLNAFHLKNKEYPIKYDELKDYNFNSFSYERKNSNDFEINVTIKFYFRKDVKLKSDSNGVYRLNPTNGNWEQEIIIDNKENPRH